SGSQMEWAAAEHALHQRSVSSTQLHAEGVGHTLSPLSNAEAAALSESLQRLPAEARLDFFARAARSMDNGAYKALTTQLVGPHGSAGMITAYAGYLYGQTDPRGRVAARAILRGEDILRGGGAPQGQEGAPERRATPLISMPPEDQLRRQWNA